MSIRAKVLFISACSLIVACVGLFAAVGAITARNIETLEFNLAENDVRLLAGALSVIGQDVASTAEGWGGWADPYDAMTGSTDLDQFIAENVTPEMVEPIGVDLMAYLYYDGSTAAYVLLSDAEPATSAPEGFSAEISRLGLLSNRDPQTITRLMGFLNGEAMVLATQPVTNNVFTAEPVGIVLIGKRIDDALLSSLGVDHGLSVTSVEAGVPTDKRRVTSFDLGTIAHESELDGEILKTALSVNGMDGRPLAELEMRRPRDVYVLARQAFGLLGGAFTIVVVVTLGGTLFAINRYVLSRLTRLSSEMSRIAKTPDPSDRISVSGVDEFATLGSSMNHMLESLESAHNQLRRASERNLKYAAELETSVSALNEANLAKSRFLANMSHELRTPLNSIIGFSGIGLQGLAGPVNDEQRRQLTMINRSGKHLLLLINDVLDLSKVESGRDAVVPDLVDLRELAVEAVEGLEGQAEKKGLELRLEGEEGIATIITDRRKVYQVLTNLIGNAIKFTDSGHVKVKVSRDPVDDTVIVAVSDTGVGIANGDIARVFEAFAQVGAPHRVKPEGTGLGLSISRRYAKLLGGEIVLESQVGAGSTFELVLPSLNSSAETNTNVAS